jgi:hypothetical protein
MKILKLFPVKFVSKLKVGLTHIEKMLYYLMVDKSKYFTFI